MTPQAAVARPTSWQDNAAAFATTSETAIDAQRHDGVYRTLELLLEHRTGMALYVLARSVQRQARIAGLGDAVPVPCPCGGRCRR